MFAELGAQQKSLRQALAEAARLGFTVSPDGRVGYPASPPMRHGGTATGAGGLALGAQGGDNRARAQAIADQIRRAVTRATAIDERYAAALAKLAAAPDLQVTARTWLDARNDGRLVAGLADTALRLRVPDGKDPKKTAKWWRGLTPEQRQEYITAHPDRIGALDGLPADVRDQANRLVLHETHADVQQRLNALGKPPEQFLSGPTGPVTNPLYQIWKDEHDRLAGQLKGMDAIQTNLDMAGQKNLPEGYLLGFDTRGNGHAIVARGNPDTAAHTAVYVPGTYANLAGIETGLHRGNSLWMKTAEISPGQPVSAITWLGYDAPQSIPLEAPFRSYADHGAPLLNQFVDGTRVSHQGNPTHLTMIGHSYGSTVIGSAAVHGDLNTDDIIFAGSPGVEAGRAADLGIGPEHVYSDRAPGDPVPYGGNYTELPGRYLGVPTVPGDPAFGGRTLDYGPRAEGFDPTEAHTSYFDETSISLKNMAKVIAGNE
ncbi:alpha/beta hydrolase [Actinomadura chokoriensis]|uniref:alpha/beta hydrolase n=1 Tax=Actinomadura chokoriensis TaxID=454156 RepID=UPI0031F8C8A1